MSLPHRLVLVVLFLLCAGHAEAQLFISPFDGESLKERWAIEGDSSRHWVFTPYKPVYILLANYSSDINTRPVSDNPRNSSNEPIGLDPTELKFQISFKTRAIKNLFGKKVKGDIWLAYTQTSRWQLYNAELSRPFRETNYEPELLLTVPTPYAFWGIEGAFAGIGVNHQSNGRANPLSRSWNRIIFQLAFQARSWSFILKPWWRVPESEEDDDNPGIENYMGRMELVTAYSSNRHDVSLLARHSLKGGDDNRGMLQLDYALRLYDFLKVHLQIFSGYGESMIDYNHNQTTFGIGFSLIEWR